MALSRYIAVVKVYYIYGIINEKVGKRFQDFEREREICEIIPTLYCTDVTVGTTSLVADFLSMLHSDTTRDPGKDFARAVRQQNGQSITVSSLTVERHFIIHLPL